MKIRRGEVVVVELRDLAWLIIKGLLCFHCSLLLGKGEKR